MNNDKNGLKSFIKSIIETLQSQINTGNFTIIVFDTEVDKLPHFVSPKGKYVCLVEFERLKKVDEFSSVLSKLLGKDIFKVVLKDKIGFYWFEGELFNTQIDSSLGDTTQEESKEIPNLKTNTRLPKWLDKFLYSDLKAEYYPDFEKFEFNLNLTGYDLLRYLGTYFPRSYAETKCIIDDLFLNHSFKLAHSNLHSYNILDIGCGSGGNLIGLLEALVKNNEKVSEFNIYTLDGNVEAIGIMKSIIAQFVLQYGKKINLKTCNKKLNQITEIEDYTNEFESKSFHWILTSKFIGELVSENIVSNCNAYYELTSLLCPLLNRIGLLIEIDVTIKAKNDNYLPIMLNSQIRKFLSENPNYTVLAPLSCNNYSSICHNECFCQQTFTISHSHKLNDISRVVYKIIGNLEFANEIIKNLEIGKFVISWRMTSGKKTVERCCPHSESEHRLIDSYKLS